MRKLFALIIGIVIILSLTSAVPAMAGKPVVSPAHYDVNFITGVVDTLALPIYQIKVSASGISTINVVADTAFGVTNWDATVGNGTVTVPSGATYTVYAQFRSSGKPNASANLTLVSEGASQFPTSTKNEWVLISTSVHAGDTILFANNKCSNFATRWFLNESEEPVVLFDEDFTDIAAGEIPAGWSETAAYPNWGVSIYWSQAGGITPEMVLTWEPSFDGISRLTTPEIDASAYSDIGLTFKHLVDHWAIPYTLKVQVSVDGGTNWADAWSVSPTGDIGPATVAVDLSAYDGLTFQLAWVFDGDSYNIDYWHIDDISVTGS